jgi:hypothetical protein
MKTGEIPLVPLDPAFDSQVARTRPGQAHFAGTGPFGATCGECAFLGYWRQVRSASGDLIRSERSAGCAKFHQLTGKHGPAVQPGTDACRHFARKEKAG